MTIEEANEIEYRMNILKPVFDEMLIFMKSTILKYLPNTNFIIVYKTANYFGRNVREYIEINFKEIYDKHNTDDDRKWQLIHTMIHESIHKIQFIDHYKYNNDKEYNIFIESNCDSSALNFIIENYNTLVSIAGCKNYEISLYHYNDSYSRSNLYDDNNLEIILFLKLMAQISFKNYNKLKELYWELYYSYKNIIIDYYIKDDNGKVENCKFYLKSNDKLNIDVYQNILSLLLPFYHNYKIGYVEDSNDTILFEIHCEKLYIGEITKLE